MSESERRFTGQILDPEFGLYYYGARYYDPELARFISPDPIVPSAGDPQTLNRYSYVRNNPVKYIDPTGHDFWSDLGNFFKNFFKSLPALITGIVVGWATWGIGIPILSGMLGGMAAAAVNTAMNGGNFGYNIGMGALFGGIAGAIGPGVFEGMGGVVSDGFAWSNFLPAVKAGAVVGAALGGLSTAIGGGNFFQNVAFGALGGGMGSAIGYGVAYGLNQGWAAAKEWWNSVPATLRSQGGFVRVGCCDKDISPPSGFDPDLEGVQQAAARIRGSVQRPFDFDGGAGGLGGKANPGGEGGSGLGSEVAPRVPARPPLPASPSQAPGAGWEWRGSGPVGSSRGNWYNPSTGESLHIDLGHGAPIGPHYDYKASNGNWYRIFPDGSIKPK